MKVTVAELRKLRDLVIASANNSKMRGETIVRGFQMANEIYKKTYGDGFYSVDLFYDLNEPGKCAERVIDGNKAKRGGKALVYSAATPGAFISVSNAYTEMCLHDIGMFDSTDGVPHMCAHDAVDQLVGVALLSPKRDFEFVLDYFMKRASDETGRDNIAPGFGCAAISEVLKLRKALEKEYKLDGSLCHAAKMGFMETPEANREYIEAIANGRDSSPLSNVGSVSILATVLLAATMFYLRTVRHTEEDFYNRAYGLYDKADKAAIHEYHPWAQTVYTQMNILNQKGAVSTPVRLYVDSLRNRLNESIKLFVSITGVVAFSRLLTSICFIQQEGVTVGTYMDFNRDEKSHNGEFEARAGEFLMRTYWDAVRLTGIAVNDSPKFELFK